MAAEAATNDGIPAIFHTIARHRHLIVPVSFLALVGVLVVPLPSAILDLLICLNIAIGAIVLMTTIYMRKPLDFSVFPALLLGTTLFRLVLNVASTRLILSVESKDPKARYFHISEAEPLNEKQFAAWVKQASKLPGWEI